MYMSVSLLGVGLDCRGLCCRSVCSWPVLLFRALGFDSRGLCSWFVFLVLVAQTGRAFIADHGQVMSGWVIAASSSDGH